MKAATVAQTNLFVRPVPGADASAGVPPGEVVDVLDEVAVEATARDVNQSTHKFRKVKRSTGAVGFILESHLDFSIKQDAKKDKPE